MVAGSLNTELRVAIIPKKGKCTTTHAGTITVCNSLYVTTGILVTLMATSKAKPQLIVEVYLPHYSGCVKFLHS